MENNNAEALKNLLGEDVILIPLLPGTKTAAVKWKGLTLEDSKEHVEAIKKGEIGVLMAGNLCSIDLDSDQAVKEMVALNPWLNETLKTVGKRGANFWLKIDGPYPRYLKFNVDDSIKGEIRAGTGFYTKISGIHPETGKPYWNNGKSVKTVKFNHIKWPISLLKTYPSLTNVNSSDKLNTVELNSEELDHCETGSLDNCGAVGLGDCDSGGCDAVSLCTPPVKSPTQSEAEATAEEFRANAQIDANYEAWKTKEHSEIAEAYKTHVHRLFPAEKGKRNDTVVKAATYLFFAVSPELAEKLLGVFYDINQPLFNDSKDQHMTEVRAQLENVEKTFIEGLPTLEKTVYLAMSERHKATFRIMRDLAKFDETGQQTFFLSVRELRIRLSCAQDAAYTIIKRFLKANLIVLIEKGTVRQKNGEAKASVYRWSWPIPKVAKSEDSKDAIGETA